ncbi:MAG: AbrB/MazE/SpoVT family DNA-binding domain-containing protein [Vicinamibacteria bacterium]
MSKVTSKLQVTLPKAIADRYGVKPGADLVFEPAGDSIRVLVAREPGLAPFEGMALSDKQALFDAATLRQEARDRKHRIASTSSKGSRSSRIALSSRDDRGWTREELYARARAR